jgi:hypothetical protein
MQMYGPKIAAIGRFGVIRSGTRSGMRRLLGTQFRREKLELSPSTMPDVGYRVGAHHVRSGAAVFEQLAVGHLAQACAVASNTPVHCRVRCDTIVADVVFIPPPVMALLKIVSYQDNPPAEISINVIND